MALPDYLTAIINASTLVKDNKSEEAITLLQAAYDASIIVGDTVITRKIHEQLIDTKVKFLIQQGKYDNAIVILQVGYTELGARYGNVDRFNILNRIANIRGTLSKDYKQAAIDYGTIIDHYLTKPLLVHGVYKVMFCALLCDTINQLVTKRNGKIGDTLLRSYRDKLEGHIFDLFVSKADYKYIGKSVV